jgi:hypothetical protein
VSRRDDNAQRVTNVIALIVSRPLVRGRGFRRACTSKEIAHEGTMPLADVNLVGRAEKRLYFDMADRQFRATYQGAGRWRINHRARYW